MKIKRRNQKFNQESLEEYTRRRAKQIKKAKMERSANQFINKHFSVAQQRLILKVVLVFILFLSVIRLCTAYVRFHENANSIPDQSSQQSSILDSIDQPILSLYQ